MTRVLVVGQTPPPYGGQAIMIQSLLDGELQGVELFHVRMAFSRSMDEVGKLSAHKVLHTARVLGAIVYMRLRHGTDTLYYPPSGPSRGALLRDCALLLPTRWLFARTVFHFHAGGTATKLATLSLLERMLVRLALDAPDCSVRTSPLSPPDGEALHSRLDVVVPNGIEDPLASLPEGAVERAGGGRPVILFAGLLCASKGIDVLVEAAELLAREGRDFEVRAIGAWESPAYREQVLARVAALGLSERVRFPGVLTGERKTDAFSAADIFCFPSFFEAETFGVAVLEAMAFALPVVASDWRGLPALVADGVTGFVVPTHDARAVATKLAVLLDQPDRRRAQGAAGRDLFLSRYTRARYLEGMRQVFLRVAGEVAP